MLSVISRCAIEVVMRVKSVEPV